LFQVNIALLIGLNLAFWFGVRLLDTLWLMLFFAPFSLFLFNKGLKSKASCEVNQ